MRRLSHILKTMNFEETEEQNMIRNMVRDFAEEILLPTTLARDQNKGPRWMSEEILRN